MAPGSVIIDLAGEPGGNTELTGGRDVVEDGVKVIAPGNLPSRDATDASQLYAKNIENLLALLVDDEGKLSIDFDDEIVAGACITHDGEIRNERAREREGGRAVAMDLMTEMTIFVLAAFVGFEVISKVPTTLHTPLMSQTNAIHGIVMLGGLIVVGYADDSLEKTIGLIAIAFGTINIVGGFLVTDRMLGHVRPQAEAEARRKTQAEVTALPRSAGAGRGRRDPALHRLVLAASSSASAAGTHPTTAKQGNLIAAVGMAVAVVTTLLLDGIGNWGLIAGGLADRDRGRRGRLDPRPDDGDAADGRALQRRRRRRGRADRLVGAPPRDLARRRDPARRADPGPLLGGRRLGLVLGLEHRLREAPGPDPDQAARGPGPAGDQRAAADRDRRLPAS